jgi:hypothetical protein
MPLPVSRLVLAACVLATVACADPPRAGEGEGEGEGEFTIEPGGDVSAHIAAPDADVGFTEDPLPGATGSCSTNQWWQRGDRESVRMHPGRACIECHVAEGEGPDLVYGGTVHQAMDDMDDCRGVGGVLIDIIDDDTGLVVASTITNDAGNFLFQADDFVFTQPYRVSMFLDGRTRDMLTPQTDGDCMTCHTADGLEGAPGRIVAP